MSTEEYPIWIADAIFHALRETGAIEIGQASEPDAPSLNDRYLAYIRANPGATTHDIADDNGEVRTAGYQRLLRLEKRGLVRKEGVRGHMVIWYENV